MTAEFYETDRAMEEYLLFHYGSPTETCPYSMGPTTAAGFAVRCVTELLEVAEIPAHAIALDLGCSVGRSTFELAKHCFEVIGIDSSRRFVEAAQTIAETGSLDFSYAVEGDLRTAAKAVPPQGVGSGRVRFERGDAMALRMDLGSFDVVLMANLLCRLPEPKRCLDQAANLVKTGGQLLITTPCTWLTEYTPKANWLGGFERNGKPVRTLDTLKSELETEFRLEVVRDLPFLIREHERKFQWNVAQGTRWRRR